MASLSERRVLGGIYCSDRFFGRVDHGDDDSLRASVKHAADNAWLVPRDATDRGALLRQRYCLEHHCCYLVVRHTVLHVDADVVEIDSGCYFSCMGIRQREPGAQHFLI